MRSFYPEKLGLCSQKDVRDRKDRGGGNRLYIESRGARGELLPEEFERYADLFEEMLERMEEEAEGEESEPQVEPEWSPVLDEFDLAEITGMRGRFGLIREA
jgi:hypothetical protein